MRKMNNMKLINKIEEYKELKAIKKRTIERLEEIGHSKINHRFLNKTIKLAQRYKLALRKLSKN